MEELIHRAIGSSSQINLQLDSTIWNIKTNIAQLESSLLNIAINARDAGSAGIHLNISTENVVLEASLHLGEGHSGRKHVRISVSDNGCGISEDMIDKITPSFTTKAAGKGTGLGLAMVKGFVSDMDGKLEVESVVGQGTTMHLYFPRDEML